MNLSFATYINSVGRLVEDQRRRLSCKPLREGDLLAVPAGEGRNGLLNARCLHLVGRRSARRNLTFTCTVQYPDVCEASDYRQCDVVNDGFR
jgi:hypothetical protein